MMSPLGGHVAVRTMGLLGPWRMPFERSAASGAERCYNRLMLEAWYTAGKPSLHDKGRVRSCGGCLLVGAILFSCLLVFGFGLGLPYTYWLQIAEVQAFEGE